MEYWPECNRLQISAETEEAFRFMAQDLVRNMGYNESSKYLIALVLVEISYIIET